MHLSELLSLNLRKIAVHGFSILKLFTNIVHEFSLKNEWLPPIFFFDFSNTC